MKMMKKLISIALCLLLFLSVAGCGRNTAAETKQQTTVKEISVGQKYYTVDTAERKIFDEGQNCYLYRIGGNKITIYYPNGYYCTSDGHIITGDYASGSSGSGESPLLGTTGYASSLDLVNAVEKAETTGSRVQSNRSGNKNIGEKIMVLIIAILILVLGIFGYSDPEKMFQYQWGRMIQDAQPTYSYLKRTKVVSVFTIIFGIIILICGLSM